MRVLVSVNRCYKKSCVVLNLHNHHHKKRPLYIIMSYLNGILLLACTLVLGEAVPASSRAQLNYYHPYSVYRQGKETQHHFPSSIQNQQQGNSKDGDFDIGGFVGSLAEGLDGIGLNEETAIGDMFRVLSRFIKKLDEDGSQGSQAIRSYLDKAADVVDRLGKPRSDQLARGQQSWK